MVAPRDSQRHRPRPAGVDRAPPRVGIERREDLACYARVPGPTHTSSAGAVRSHFGEAPGWWAAFTLLDIDRGKDRKGAIVAGDRDLTLARVEPASS
ncbi:MAG: hypothetical protein ABWY12_16695 [Burkholderiales bacterium]